METSSPGTTIQVENQVPDSANPTSNQSRNRRSNRPKFRVPPTNTASSDVVVAPQTGGTRSTQPPGNFNQNRSHDHKQERSNPRRPPGASQTAGSSSVVDETGGGNARPRKTVLQDIPREQPLQMNPTLLILNNSRRRNVYLGVPNLIPKAHLPLQVSSLSKKEQPPRRKAPLADDLTSTLTHALSTRPYPDCPICFNPIRPEQHTCHVLLQIPPKTSNAAGSHSI
ncbi:hypothetical protein BDR07DRAFT_1498656 [Suillus spraguei]|nr:hypothetical protein BDR07DRAFT_1498656 [Suillus spraguei]